jgi:predicted membrane protein
MSFLFRWALTLPFIIVIVGFSALHSQKITIHLEPLYKNIALPLFVPVIAFVFIGFLWGALINWINTAPLRHKSRAQSKEIKTLKKDVADLQEKLAQGGKNQKKSNLASTAFDLLPARKNKPIDNSDML